MRYDIYYGVCVCVRVRVRVRVRVCAWNIERQDFDIFLSICQAIKPLFQLIMLLIFTQLVTAWNNVNPVWCNIGVQSFLSIELLECCG